MLAVEGTIESLRDERTGDFEIRLGRHVPAASAEALRRAGVRRAMPSGRDSGRSPIR